MTAEAEAPVAGGLTALDWVVIVAAAAALVITITWLVQGAPLPKPKTDKTE